MGRNRAILPPSVRSPRTRRTNRVGLAVCGLLLLLGGGAGLAAGLGLFGTAVQHRAVLGNAGAYARTHNWVWIATGLAGALCVLVAVRWLAIQLRSNRMRELDLSDDPRHGRTTMPARAVTAAIEDEIEHYRGVDGASAHLVTERGRAVLLVDTALDGRIGPAEIRDRIQTEALVHARQALDAPRLPIRMELRLTARERRDVR